MIELSKFFYKVNLKMDNRVYYGEYSLKHWIDLVLKKNIVLPEYQRYFVWKEHKVRTLIETFKNKKFVPPVTIGVYKINGNSVNLILDGQQRITSILLAYLGLYPDAKKMEMISYEEMMELAFLGAGVMEPRAVELGGKYGVEIYVGKSLGERNGTIITSKEKVMEKKLITGISINENILMVNIENIPTYAKNVYEIFKVAEEFGVSIGIISQNDVTAEKGSIAFTAAKTDEAGLEKAIVKLKDKLKGIEVNVKKDVSKVSLVGIGMVSTIGIASKTFKVLSENNISFHQVSTSEISVSLVVDTDKAKDVARLLSKEFEI